MAKQKSVTSDLLSVQFQYKTMRVLVAGINISLGPVTQPFTLKLQCVGRNKNRLRIAFFVTDLDRILSSSG